MADNLTITGVGAVATDEIGGFHFQRVKLTWGANGVAVDTSADNPLPVSLQGSVAVTGSFYQTTQPVSAAAWPLPTGAATEATLAAAVTALQLLDNTVAGNEMQVDVLTSALPTGASTSAKQDTIIGHVDAVETKLDSIITALATLDGRVDGLETAIGTTADAASTTTGSLIAHARATKDALLGVDDPWGKEIIEPSQTDQMCGSTGAIGDLLHKLIIIPLTTSPGEVSIEDGSTNSVVFAGGASSVATLHPFEIAFDDIDSKNGGWEVSTGVNVRVWAIGSFT